MSGFPTWTSLNQTVDGQYCGAEVSCQNCLLGYKNVALIASRVGARAFVEDHNSVIQVMVNIM